MADDGRTFKAEGLSKREWGIVETARSDIRERTGVEPSNKELLLLMANDTSAQLRKKP